MKKRVLAVILAVLLVAQALPMNAFASDEIDAQAETQPEAQTVTEVQEMEKEQPVEEKEEAVQTEEESKEEVKTPAKASSKKLAEVDKTKAYFVIEGTEYQYESYDGFISKIKEGKSTQCYNFEGFKFNDDVTPDRKKIENLDVTFNNSTFKEHQFAISAGANAKMTFNGCTFEGNFQYWGSSTDTGCIDFYFNNCDFNEYYFYTGDAIGDLYYNNCRNIGRVNVTCSNPLLQNAKGSGSTLSVKNSSFANTAHRRNGYNDDTRSGNYVLVHGAHFTNYEFSNNTWADDGSKIFVDGFNDGWVGRDLSKYSKKVIELKDSVSYAPGAVTNGLELFAVEAPEYDMETSIKVTVKTVNEEGIATKTNAKYTFKVFDDEEIKNQSTDIAGDELVKTVELKNADTADFTFEKVPVGSKGGNATFYLAEYDKDGNLIDTAKYEVGEEKSEGKSEVVVNKDKKGEVVVTNIVKEEPAPAPEYALNGTINITKNVVNKSGKALKVTDTFYVGVFSDKECTKLVDDPVNEDKLIVPIVMDNQSSKTVSVTVPVEEKGKAVKYYVKEVDENGNPVASNKKFAYNDKYNKTSVSVSTAKAGKVTITNQLKNGNVAPESNGVKTGDNGMNEMLLYLAMAMIAAAGLVTVVKMKRNA